MNDRDHFGERLPAGDNGAGGANGNSDCCGGPETPLVRKVEFQPLPEPAGEPGGKGIAPQFHGVMLRLSAELGKITLPVRELINLGVGSKLKLQRVADEQVLLLVNEIPFAHGEVVVINDRFGVRVGALVDGDTPGQKQKS
jgi:flagellar motor switch protein FliN/FliY